MKRFLLIVLTIFLTSGIWYFYTDFKVKQALEKQAKQHKKELSECKKVADHWRHRALSDQFWKKGRPRRK